MQCENCYCVYWTQTGCFLHEIELDIQGRCQMCIYAEIPDATLRQARERARWQYEQMDGETNLTKMQS